MVDAVIKLLKDRVFAFDIGQPRFINPVGIDHFVKAREAMDVVFEAFDGVLHHRAGRNDKRPVGRLRQQQLARGLVQRALQQAVGVREALGHFDQATFGGVLVHVNPIGLPVDPDAVVAFRAPGRS